MYERNFVLPLTNYNCNGKTNENEFFGHTISVIIIIVSISNNPVWKDCYIFLVIFFSLNCPFILAKFPYFRSVDGITLTQIGFFFFFTNTEYS